MIDQWLNSWDDVSNKIWEKICKRNPPVSQDREFFELLASAFIYDLNGVKEFGEKHIHEPIDPSRSNPGEYKFKDFFDLSQHPYHFCRPLNVKGKGEYFGSMHMASASFRISTAIYLLGKRGMQPFNELMKEGILPDDWNREKLEKYLSKADKRCSGFHVLTLKDYLDSQDLGLYAAMVVAYRDEFGHGEKGDGTKGWRRMRGDEFPHFLRCQLIEAHMNLIYMGLR